MTHYIDIFRFNLLSVHPIIYLKAKYGKTIAAMPSLHTALLAMYCQINFVHAAAIIWHYHFSDVGR